MSLKELEEAIKNHPRIDAMKPSHSKDVTVFIKNLLDHINGCEGSIEKIEVEFVAFKKQLEDFEPLIARHKNIQFQIRAKSQKESDALADNQMLWNKLTDKIKELLAYGTVSGDEK